MQLIGMLDSPYVRRVAISLQALAIPFAHQSISVFRGFKQFQGINPVVKAPSLICDNGDVLLDSTLIIEYAEALARKGKSLMPKTVPELQRDLRIIGLALAACEKSVQIVYERNLRPAEKQHQPWVERVTAQVLAAYELLEKEIAELAPTVSSNSLTQAVISSAVAWHFTQAEVPGVVPVARFPQLTRLSAAAEDLPEFRAAAHGDSTYRQAV
jgi:glutathione S-transferase